MSNVDAIWSCANCDDTVDSRYAKLDCFSNPTGDVLCEACLEDLASMYHMTKEELDEELK